MEQREKLIELLANPNKTDECLGGWCSNECKYFDSGDYCKTEMLSDHLLANGVVVLPCRCCECEFERTCKAVNQYLGRDGYCCRARRKGGDE